MSLSLEINAVERISNLKKRSLRITKHGDGVNNCSFVLNTQAGVYKPVVGQEVVIDYDATQVFGGIIKSVFTEKITPAMGNTADIEISVSCDGYNEIPSRRTVAAEYIGDTAGDIVEALRALTINAEGVGAGTISAGITVPYFLQICVSLKQVYDELAASCGFKWFIDEAKDLYFISESAIVDADEDLVEGGSFTDFASLYYTESLQDYANKVFVKGGWGTDGALLYLNVEDATEIAARAVIEGGTGVYGIVIEDSNIVTEADATALAELYLQKHAFAPGELRFSSYKTDWVVGTRLKVNLPAIGIATDTYFLIEEITIIREDGDILKSNLKCTKRQSGLDFSTQRSQTGNDYFVKLVREAKKGGGSVSGGLASILTNATKAYRDSNAALVTVTTAETSVCTKEITLDTAADVHLTFSAYLESIESITIDGKTYLTTPDVVATARDFLPEEDNANFYVHPNHTGDVTSVGDGAQTIADQAVTLAKMENRATQTLIGRLTAGAGVPEELSAANARTILNVADGANAYVHPNHSGDVTSVADGAQTIVAEAVTLAKMATLDTQRVIGRDTAGAGVPESLTMATLKTMLGIDAKYAASIGDGVETDIVVTHSLNSRDVQVYIYTVASPYEQVFADIEHTSLDTVTIKFATAPTASQYRVVVIGGDTTRYSITIGDGLETEITATHGLSTRDVGVHLYEAASPYEKVSTTIKHATVDTVVLEFSVAPTTNQYRVVVIA